MSTVYAPRPTITTTTLEVFVTEIPSDTEMRPEDADEGGSGRSFLPSRRQTPPVYTVDVNANDCSLAVEETAPAPSKEADASRSTTFGGNTDNRKRPADPPPHHCLDETVPDVCQHQDVTCLAWNAVNSVDGCELKVREETDGNPFNRKNADNNNRYMNLRKKSRR